ncbi:hypothetical protein OAM34_01600 [Alphaproteobacteria bacterium]|nr:hypothetical protein [Alphaproteobacteria bacterium]
MAAKKNSKRFPGKNFYQYQGVPLFWHSVQPLINSNLVSNVYVASDSDEVIKFCLDKDVKTIFRGVNAILDEEPLLNVLRYCVMTIDDKFDAIITIMANCPNHLISDVDSAINLMKQNPNLLEVRSFDKQGNETGLIVLRRSVILNNHQISSHLGSIKTSGFEVHYKNDL